MFSKVDSNKLRGYVKNETNVRALKLAEKLPAEMSTRPVRYKLYKKWRDGEWPEEISKLHANMSLVWRAVHSGSKVVALVFSREVASAYM